MARRLNWEKVNKLTVMTHHGATEREHAYDAADRFLDMHQSVEEHRRRVIENGKTEAGGYTRQQLEAWGVRWPPMKGWKEYLVANGFPKAKR